jgi:hypothetical protein
VSVTVFGAKRAEDEVLCRPPHVLVANDKDLNNTFLSNPLFCVVQVRTLPVLNELISEVALLISHEMILVNTLAQSLGSTGSQELTGLSVLDGDRIETGALR